jgi:hypothetical protein
VSNNICTAGSPAALGSAGYWSDRRSNERAGNGVCRASPQTHWTAAPASSAVSRARHTATSEMSIAVTVQPRRASQIASAPSPQPTSSAHPGVRSATSTTSPPVWPPAPHRPVALAVPRVPLGRLRRRAEPLLAVFVHAPYYEPAGHGCRAQCSPLITKYEPRIVPASFDFCRANLNEPSSAGTSIPSESLNPTARFFGSSSGYRTLIESPLS